jgi:biotin transport system substrate-specific component
MTVTSAVVASRPIGVRVLAALAGALVVAGAAQVAVPLPGTAVPMTLQPLAVLIVGGLLGPAFGALSMVMYLTMGAAGLPVFTPLGVPGVARLIGPTGGYLIAYPLAAAVAGLSVRSVGGQDRFAILLRPRPRFARASVPSVRRSVVCCAAAMALIHLGGAAQLAILTGSAAAAFAVGTLPFLAGDLLKVAVAALIVARLSPLTRALR